MNWIVLSVFGLFLFLASLLGVSFTATLARNFALSREIGRRRRSGALPDAALARAAEKARRVSGMASKAQRVTMGAAAAGGILLIGIGLSLLRDARAFRARAARADGVVTGFLASGGDEFPRISFSPSEAKHVTFAARLGGGGPFRYQEGERVRVLYDPLQPGSARIDSFPQLWFVPLFVALFGAVLLLVPMLFLAGAAHERLRLAVEESGPR